MADGSAGRFFGTVRSGAVTSEAGSAKARELRGRLARDPDTAPRLQPVRSAIPARFGFRRSRSSAPMSGMTAVIPPL